MERARDLSEGVVRLEDVGKGSLSGIVETFTAREIQRLRQILLSQSHNDMRRRRRRRRGMEKRKRHER